MGQPRSTIDPLAWLRSGAIVIINTAKGTVGEDTAALLGATLLNLLALGVAERADLPAAHRPPVTFIVDEFHSLPGADYEAILSELAKYGANLVLATQSLATLEVLDRAQDRALRAKVFSNLDGLFAFHTSAEDARYLVPELGDEVDVADLVALGEHQCYVRLSARGSRLPVFSVRLDPPPASDPARSHRLAHASASRYGRDRALVDRDLRSALARIEATHGTWDKDEQGGQGAKGIPVQGTKTPKEGPPRSEHRNRPELRQTKLPGMGADGHGAEDNARQLQEGVISGGEGVA